MSLRLPWPNTSLVEKSITYFSPRDAKVDHRRHSLAIHLAKKWETWKLRTMRPEWNLFYSTHYEEKDISLGGTEGTTLGPNSMTEPPCQLASGSLAPDSPVEACVHEHH